MREVNRIINIKYMIIVLIFMVINALALVSFSCLDLGKQNIYTELLSMTKDDNNGNGSNRESVISAWKQYVIEHGITGETITDEQKNARQILIDEANYIDNYESNLDNEIAQAKNSLNSIIYKDNSFEKINAYKTMQDLIKQKNADVLLSNGYWLKKITDFGYLNIFALILVFYVVYRFCDEKKTGLQYIIHAGKDGRTHLFFTRVRLIVVTSFVINFILFAESVAILLWCYGGIQDVSVIASSDSLFFLTASTMTRLQFVFYIWIISSAFDMVLGLLLWWVLNMFHNVNIGLLSFILVGAVQLAIYYAISYKSIFRSLHYVNIYYLIYPMKAIEYGNWGYSLGVMSILESTLIFALILGSMAVIFNLRISVFRYEEKRNLIEIFVNKLLVWFQKFFSKLPVAVMECHKILVVQKGWLVLCIIIFIALKLQIGSGVVYDPVKYYMSKYYDMADGKTYGDELEDIYNYFETQCNDFIENVDYNNSSANTQVQNQKNLLENIRKSVDYVKEQSASGREAIVIKPYEYEGAFGEEQQKNREYIVLLISLVVVFVSAGFISYERKCYMLPIVNTYRGRKKWIVRKLLVIAIIVFATMVIIYGNYYYKLFDVYQVNQFDIPAFSLKMFSKLKSGITIRQLIIFDLLFKYVAFMTLALIVCCISMKTKYIYSLVIGTIPILPHLMYMLGFQGFSVVSYVVHIGEFFFIHGMFDNAAKLMFCCCLIIFGVLSIFNIKKKNNGA